MLSPAAAPTILCRVTPESAVRPATGSAAYFRVDPPLWLCLGDCPERSPVPPSRASNPPPPLAKAVIYLRVNIPREGWRCVSRQVQATAGKLPEAASSTPQANMLGLGMLRFSQKGSRVATQAGFYFQGDAGGRGRGEREPASKLRPGLQEGSRGPGSRAPASTPSQLLRVGVCVSSPSPQEDPSSLPAGACLHCVFKRPLSKRPRREKAGLFCGRNPGCGGESASARASSPRLSPTTPRRPGSDPRGFSRPPASARRAPAWIILIPRQRRGGLVPAGACSQAPGSPIIKAGVYLFVWGGLSPPPPPPFDFWKPPLASAGCLAPPGEAFAIAPVALLFLWKELACILRLPRASDMT